MADAFDMRHKSRTLVDGPERAAARSYFHSVGYDRDDRMVRHLGATVKLVP